MAIEVFFLTAEYNLKFSNFDSKNLKNRLISFYCSAIRIMVTI